MTDYAGPEAPQQGFVVDDAGNTLMRLHWTGLNDPAGLPGKFVLYGGDGDVDDLETFMDGTTISFRARSDDAAEVLAIARMQAWEAAKAYRDRCSNGGCQTPLGRMDTSDDSQRKLNGAVTAALTAKTLGQAFTVDWTMQDNSVATHTADQMIAAGMAVVKFLDACQKAGTAIRAQILASADPASVDVTAGYP